MSCLPCGKVTASEQTIIKYYKSTGKDYYVYRLASNKPFNIIEKEYFNKVFKEQIKSNFINGAEYFSIQEFKGH